MSQGTLFADQKIRGLTPKILVKYFNLDVKVVDPAESAEYKSKFPLKKVPTFVGPKGFKLQEVIAISIYLVNLAGAESKLLGKNSREHAEVLKWLSIGTSEFMTTASNVFKPLLGAVPYNKKQVDENSKYLNEVVSLYEKRLADYTYLVGERLTLADIFSAVMFIRGFDHLFGSEWRNAHPNVTRWFKTIIKTPYFVDFVKDYKFRENPLEYVPPKKEKKQQQKKEAAPAAAPAAAVQEEEPAPAPKAKHPLSLLEKAKAPLDKWKGVYSNEDTREKAIPWFWENQVTEDYSLWKVDYKYNDELTLTFMSNNLVGGFFNRLSASAKYMFGCMVVYGENNNNGITGFFIIRGDDHAAAFDVAPDWESYAYTKLDSSDPETKKFVNNMLAWDEPVVVNGETIEIADGKVFK